MTKQAVETGKPINQVEQTILGFAHCLSGTLLAQSSRLPESVVEVKWAIDPAVFWRHSLGCALASRDFADRIGYIDPDKAYLAGLLHEWTPRR